MQCFILLALLFILLISEILSKFIKSILDSDIMFKTKKETPKTFNLSPA